MLTANNEYQKTNTSTICAISTPAGIGGIAVIRVSGGEAFANCDKIFHAAKAGKTIATQKPYTISFGQIVNAQGNVIDEVLVSVFRAPHSFTGEDVVEISCHGSIFIQQQILNLLIANGCTLARAGEFTQRAFLNGKMDLSQAEAVADLISSTSAAAHRVAMNQMRGTFSDKLKDLRAKLLDFASLVELELDFSEEDVQFADRQKLRLLANEIEEYISKLCASFEVGNVIKNGVPVAIVGETNVGKSTLLNVLLGEERAIVSDIHGTTRDAIEDTVSLGGITFRFIDTAGIRDTHDTIENIGIERTYDKIAHAAIVLWLVDASQPVDEKMLAQMQQRCTGKKLIIVANKTDLNNNYELKIKNYEVVKLSAKFKQNIDVLQQKLIEAAQIPAISAADVIVTNARHIEALRNARAAIERVQQGLQQNISGDLLAQDIRECLYHIGTITGEISSNEILENIFSKFCIGK